MHAGTLFTGDATSTFADNGCRPRLMRMSRGMRHSGDVVVIPEFKAVYVVMVKSASESIRTKLRDDFGVNWKQPIPGSLGRNPAPGLRQKSHLLTPEIIRDYTFFTFVRNPATRFRSSYAQAMCLDDAAAGSPPKCRLCRKAELAVTNPEDVPRRYMGALQPGAENVYTPTLEEFAGALLRRRRWTAKRIADGIVFTVRGDLEPNTVTIPSYA